MHSLSYTHTHTLLPTSCPLHTSRSITCHTCVCLSGPHLYPRLSRLSHAAYMLPIIPSRGTPLIKSHDMTCSRTPCITPHTTLAYAAAQRSVVRNFSSATRPMTHGTRRGMIMNLENEPCHSMMTPLARTAAAAAAVPAWPWPLPGRRTKPAVVRPTSA